MRDYRDRLKDILEDLHRSGVSRYKIARVSGISEQTLSNIVHKRRNLSVESLQHLLGAIGYEMEFHPLAEEPVVPSSNGQEVH